MILIAEVVLFVAGIVFLARRGVGFGDYILPRPYTTYIGLVFMLTLPVAFLAVAAFGAAEGVKAVRAGAVPDPKKLTAKATYVELGAVGAALVSAVGVAAYGGRRYEPLYLPPEEVEGVRDYAAERERGRVEEQVRRAAYK
jgi:hypothetical protein